MKYSVMNQSVEILFFIANYKAMYVGTKSFYDLTA